MAIELLTPFTKVELEPLEEKRTADRWGFWVEISTLFTMLI